jgi:CIC family chloride channel protein
MRLVVFFHKNGGAEFVRRLARLAWLAAATGAGTGLVAVALWLLADAVTTGVGTAPAGASLVGAPVLGGLGYGLLVHACAPRTRGLGIPDVMLAVSGAGTGTVGTRAAAVRAIGAVLCVGTGGSLGLEGPAVVAGSAIGSLLARRAGIRPHDVRLLVGCGVAAATAVIFDAPVTGVVFAVELFLVGPLVAECAPAVNRLAWHRADTVGGSTVRRPGPGRAVSVVATAAGVLALAALVATGIRRGVLGTTPFVEIRETGAGLGLDAALVVGMAGGLVGAGFGALVYLAEDLVDRVWRGPEWLRPAAGGVLLGLLLLALPQLYGTGHPIIERAAAGALPVVSLLVLAAGKAVAASFTLAIGGIGGVFAPMLFVGATLGSAWAMVAGTPASGCALAGMAAVVCGGARIPATAVVLTVELAGELVPAVLVAAVVATAVGRLASPATVYTRKLLRSGVRW